MEFKISKKDKTLEKFDIEKVFQAVAKSAKRVSCNFSEDEKEEIKQIVDIYLKSLGREIIEISEMHNIVEQTLDVINPLVAKSYRDYRNYKQDFVHILDDVYKKSQSIRYIGDNSNANTDSAMVSTQRSLIYGELNKEFYQKFFLNVEERQACKDGYIYIHDMKDRLDSVNCMLCDVGNILNGGFEMGNVWYNEPKTLDVAFDVIGDITLSASSQQYGR